MQLRFFQPGPGKVSLPARVVELVPPLHDGAMGHSGFTMTVSGNHGSEVHFSSRKGPLAQNQPGDVNCDAAPVIGEPI